MKTVIPQTILEKVFNVIMERKKTSPDNSYVAALIKNGTDSILKKIGEESAEVIIAAKNKNRDEQIHEIADLWFHVLVLMADQGLTLSDISAELEKRFGLSGLEEKAQR